MYNVWQQGNEAFVQSLNFGSSGVQMVVVCCEETGLGHNQSEKCRWKCFFGQFANCVKAVDFFKAFSILVYIKAMDFFFESLQHPNSPFLT